MSHNICRLACLHPANVQPQYRFKLSNCLSETVFSCAVLSTHDNDDLLDFVFKCWRELTNNSTDDNRNNNNKSRRPTHRHAHTHILVSHVKCGQLRTSYEQASIMEFGFNPNTNSNPNPTNPNSNREDRPFCQLSIFAVDNRLTQVVLEKRPLNGCSSGSSSVYCDFPTTVSCFKMF